MRQIAETRAGCVGEHAEVRGRDGGRYRHDTATPPRHEYDAKADIDTARLYGDACARQHGERQLGRNERSRISSAFSRPPFAPDCCSKSEPNGPRGSRLSALCGITITGYQVAFHLTKLCGNCAQTKLPRRSNMCPTLFSTDGVSLPLGRPSRRPEGSFYLGPSPSLTLGSPCGRSPSPLRGAVVELPASWFVVAKMIL